MRTGMGSVLDTLSKISGGALNSGAQNIADKVSEAADIAQTYATATLVLQALSTFAAIGMLSLYAKTHKLQVELAHRRGVRMNPRRKKRGRK